MKKLLFILPLLLAADCFAVVITLKDGTRVEGTIEGDMDGVKLIKTKYGSLTIDSKDIQDLGTPEVVAKDIYNVGLSTVPVAPPAAELLVSTLGVTASTTAVAASTEPALALPELPPAPAAGPDHTFRTVTLSTSAFERIYSEGGVVIATETIDSRGELVSLAGAIKDGSYREYYENGNLKTETTVINAKANGTLKAYYPTGVLQSEAYYLQGKLSGAVRIYTENSKLLFEQNFKDGTPNGWFREYDEAGKVKSELFYTDGHPAENPKPQKEVKKADAAAENLLSARSQTLARGERISFYLNGKYIAKLQLDKDNNIISRSGKVPDGEIKLFDPNGNIEKEFVFVKDEAVSLKVYNSAGGLTAEYAFTAGKAVKK